MTDTCETCRFFNGPFEWTNGWGECRRHAPVTIPRGITTEYWPPTHPSDWCGDYSRGKQGDVEKRR